VVLILRITLTQKKLNSTNLIATLEKYQLKLYLVEDEVSVALDCMKNSLVAYRAQQ
jgi:hypothetical protein